VPCTRINCSSLSSCCSVNPEILQNMFRTGYFTGSSHRGRCPFLIDVLSYHYMILLYLEITLASSVLLHNSHNHHAAYCIAIANMMSLKYQEFMALPIPIDTTKTGPILVLVSVSVHHYAKMAVKFMYTCYITTTLLISDHEISVTHMMFSKMLCKPVQLALDLMICV